MTGRLAALGMVLIFAMAGAGSADAQGGAAPDGGVRVLGYGWLGTNDTLGDNQDRWRTGSLTVSAAFGRDWTGQAPSRLFDLWELRFQGQVIAPSDLTRYNPTDRPYAGILSLGVHTHAVRDGVEFTLGGDLVVIGPQTGLDQRQDGLHGIFGMPQPAPAVLARQIPNTVRPTAVAEIARSYDFGGAARLRPFAEMRAGDETLLRVGADVSFGALGDGGLMARESVTGQRYRVVGYPDPGFSLVMGGDIARVADSVYLPQGRGHDLTPHRDRLRAGLRWQGENVWAFYGLTWLGREFETQPESQLVGSVSLRLRF